jgi:hypothetical protein
MTLLLTQTHEAAADKNLSMDAILDGMAGCVEEAGMQISYFEMIVSFFHLGSHCAEYETVAKVAEACVRTCKRHPENEIVQIHAACTLTRLFSCKCGDCSSPARSPALAQEALLRKGVFETMLSAKHRHSDSVMLQMVANATLILCSVGWDERKSVIKMSRDAIREIVHVMKTHVTHADVLVLQRCALQTIYVILMACPHGDLHELVFFCVGEGVLDAVVGTLKTMRCRKAKALQMGILLDGIRLLSTILQYGTKDSWLAAAQFSLVKRSAVCGTV